VSLGPPGSLWLGGGCAVGLYWLGIGADFICIYGGKHCPLFACVRVLDYVLGVTPRGRATHESSHSQGVSCPKGGYPSRMSVPKCALIVSHPLARVVTAGRAARTNAMSSLRAALGLWFPLAAHRQRSRRAAPTMGVEPILGRSHSTSRVISPKDMGITHAWDVLLASGLSRKRAMPD
jgi:hypothetical protein